MFQIREDRSPQGRKKLHAERAKYFDLIAGGIGFKEAARIVGVSYRTTKRWRNGERTQKKPGTAAAPLRPRPYRASLSSRFLREADRIFIADRLVAGWSIRQIAERLGRAPSTISREVRRNRNPRSGAYRPYAARDRADARLHRRKVGKIAANPDLRAYIQEKVDRRWSPEQISHMLRREFPERRETHVVLRTRPWQVASRAPQGSAHRASPTQDAPSGPAGSAPLPRRDVDDQRPSGERSPADTGLGPWGEVFRPGNAHGPLGPDGRLTKRAVCISPASVPSITRNRPRPARREFGRPRPAGCAIRSGCSCRRTRSCVAQRICRRRTFREGLYPLVMGSPPQGSP